ncbi:hypothetical protein [Calothrix sp. NIES-3974]|nr:hypothetical protein [Calothrix sp. NIES-3974]
MYQNASEMVLGKEDLSAAIATQFREASYVMIQWHYFCVTRISHK